MNSELTLVLTPTLNDSKVAVEVLQAAGLRAHACANAHELAELIRSKCGVVLLANESLTTSAVTEIQSALDEQPTWSDLPLILLTTANKVRANDKFAEGGNTSLLERPVSKRTLVRAVQVALRARRRQYQVASLLEELTRAKESADKANFTKTQFLANMSHEIRTPIGAIIGFSDLIRQHSASPADRERYTEIIHRNSHQLLRLIDDILDISKVESGKMSIEKIEFRLPDLLADLVSIMRFKAGEKGIDFNLKLATKIPDLVCTDPVRLRQILSNVVGNAIKFTASGSVTATVHYTAPTFTFLIEDTGVGMTPEQITTLFKPFVQADSSTTRKFGGTGLGLAISKQLALALGGDALVQSSEPGKGSKFEITIANHPVQAAELVDKEALTIRSTSAAPPSVGQSLKGLNILLVEDSPDNQMLITRYLVKAGCTVTTANDGLEGVQSALKGKFDIILMDIQMPKLDGHEATKNLRAKGYSAPIIALTAHAMQEEKKRGLKSGFTDFLTKPIQPNILIDVLAAHSGRAQL